MQPFGECECVREGSALKNQTIKHNESVKLLEEAKANPKPKPEK